MAVPSPAHATRVYRLQSVLSLCYAVGMSATIAACCMQKLDMKPHLKQEAFEKCWNHSPQRAASRQFTRCRHCTVARRLRIDVHNDDNDEDNA